MAWRAGSKAGGEERVRGSMKRRASVGSKRSVIAEGAQGRTDERREQVGNRDMRIYVGGKRSEGVSPKNGLVEYVRIRLDVHHVSLPFNLGRNWITRDSNNTTTTQSEYRAFVVDLFFLFSCSKF